MFSLSVSSSSTSSSTSGSSSSTNSDYIPLGTPTMQIEQEIKEKEGSNAKKLEVRQLFSEEYQGLEAIVKLWKKYALEYYLNCTLFQQPVERFSNSVSILSTVLTDIQTFLKEEHPIYICSRDDQINVEKAQGFAVIKTFKDKTMLLEALATHPDNIPTTLELHEKIQARRKEAVGKEVGRTLITHLAKKCLEEGITSIEVAAPANAVDFYKKCHFKIVGPVDLLTELVLDQKGMHALTGIPLPSASQVKPVKKVEPSK